MAIKVGINEGVLLNKENTLINEKGTLQINFTQGQALADVPTDDLLNASAGVRASNGTNILLWPVQTESGGQPRDSERISNDLVALRDQLQHVLQGYMTSDKARLDAYADTGLTGANFSTEIMKQAVVDKVYKNLTTQFVAKVKSLTDADLAKPFRLLLVRKSDSNHYGTFRKRFITDNPFYESMEIPSASSSVRFTKYEITKGFNNPNAIDKAVAADQTEGAEESTANDILGSR